MVESKKLFANDPKTLKRQPTGSWKPVSAIGAARQTLGVDKMGSAKADAVMKKIEGWKTTSALAGGVIGAGVGLHEVSKAKQGKSKSMKIDETGRYLKIAGVFPPGAWTKLRSVGNKAEEIAKITASGAKVFEHEGNVYYQHAKNIFDKPSSGDVLSNKRLVVPGSFGSKHASLLLKWAKKKMPHFEDQHRPAEAKKVFHALKKEHPEYSAGKKARIANAVANGTVKH